MLRFSRYHRFFFAPTLFTRLFISMGYQTLLVSMSTLLCRRYTPLMRRELRCASAQASRRAVLCRATRATLLRLRDAL